MQYTREGSQTADPIRAKTQDVVWSPRTSVPREDETSRTQKYLEPRRRKRRVHLVRICQRFANRYP